MKVRESGMPDEKMWQGFFKPDHIIELLNLNGKVKDAVDFGCGYGTFTIPASEKIRGVIHAFDIEPEMIDATRNKALRHHRDNIRFHLCDFVSDGTGLPDASVDYVMLYNILHMEEPDRLLSEAFRILRDGRMAGIMHWNYDPETPRGPPMSIRPRPEQCMQWAESAGLIIAKRHIDLPPYHYGILARKGVGK
jgi:ubiquinone/menaquinone biosynthesis C-methylase UbiE